MPLNDIGRSAVAARGLTAGADSSAWLDPSGALVVIDLYTKAILDGYGYQVRAGTITTPITGDVAVTDAAAEMCADITTALTMIPLELQVTIDGMGGDALEVFAKSVATASTAGTAFTPLPLRSAGAAASGLTARAATAGGVTVTAELVTTTVRHFGYTAEFVQDAGTEAPIHIAPLIWEPLRPPVLNGIRCFYVQIASATAAPNYYAHFNVLAIPSALLGQ